MVVPFADALGRLLAPGVGRCVFRYSAGFLDEDEYTRLGSWYDETVAALTAAFGPPLDPAPQVVEPIDVERVACWRRPNGIAFAMLWFGDNTRVRILELGLAKRGEIFAGP